MIKRALEVPDDIAKWEDIVTDYIDKHYPYLSDGVSNISFSKKEESTKDGVGAAQYKNGGIEITIPIIIDDGELKEPNLGIYKEQIIPISEGMFDWIASNTQQFGQLIERDSQHISNVDYLQQTGLFEEPEGGAYVKTSCAKDTIDRVRSQAMLYPETQWLAEKLDKVAEYAPTDYLVGMDMENAADDHGVFAKTGEYAIMRYDGIPKTASAIASPRLEKQLEAMPKAASPYRRAKFTHKHADRYIMLKQAQDGEEGARENELVHIPEADTFGTYEGVLATAHGTTDVYSGEVQFDVKPLFENWTQPIAMLIVQGAPKAADPEPEYQDPKAGLGQLVTPCGDKCVLGDIYGVKKGYHAKKDDDVDMGHIMTDKSYNMGDNIMIRLGKNSYSVPYAVDSIASGLIGPKMENVTVMTLLSLLDYTKADVIVADVAELKQIPRTSIKDRQLQSMMRAEGAKVYMVPSGSIVRAPREILRAAEKGKMISDIINGMPKTNMSVVVKVSGGQGRQSFDIRHHDGDKEHQYNTASEKVANALASYFAGEQTTAEKLASEGNIPLTIKPAYAKMRKVAKIIAENTDAYIGAAAKLNRSVSRHFAKVAGVANVVNDLIGVSFVDSARDADTNKISDQVLSLINSLGNLILMARLGKTSIPETDVSRAFWSLAELLNVLRG